MLDKMITRGRTGIIDWAAVNRRARVYLDMVGLPLAPDTVIKRLSAAQKQLVQIAKALAADARALLLDEPTSSLTEHEARNLFGILRGLRDKGVTIVYVSHKFEEVFALCDKVSVLRDGRFVGAKRIGDLTQAELVKMMIGRDVTETHLGRLDAEGGCEMLRAEHVVRKGKVEDVSFAVRSGGVISALGIFMGSAIFMLIKHGLVEVKANPYYANSFLGLLILLAIVVDRVRELYSDKQKGK